MDPKLIKAIRALMMARERARVAGEDIPPGDAEAFVREETGGRYGLEDAQRLLGDIDSGITPRNLLRSAAQGALFNFGDELVGLASPDAREEMRLRESLFREAHPVADAVAGIAGGLVVPGGVGGAAARGASGVGRAVAAGAGLGALSGAAAGLGAGEGLSDRTDRAAIGAGAGLVFGAAVPGVVGAGRLAFDPAARASRRIADKIDQSGGIPALQGRLREFVDAGRGAEVVAGDLSDPLRKATDFAVQNDEAGWVDLARKVKARGAGASERILGDVESEVGNPVLGDELARLQGERRAWANPAFEALREANPVLPAGAYEARLAPLMRQPIVTRALERARRTGLIGKKPGQVDPASYQNIHDVRRALHSEASKAFKAGDGDLGSRLGEVEQEVTNFLEEYVPAFRETTSEYARRKGLERATELGAEWFNKEDTRGLRRILSEMTEEQRQQFRKGMASELLSRLRSAQTNRDLAKQIMDAGPAMQDKLELVFGSPAAFRRFLDKTAREAELAQMRGPLGGSQTHARGAAAGFDPLELVDVAHSPMSGGAQLLTRLGKGSVARRTAAQMSPWLTTQGAGSIEALLRTFQQRAPTVPAWASGQLPAATGGIWQDMFGGR